ncbi:hypothetical protein [Brevibacterium marinum]|uniref:Glycerophosphoryl diester phosphodiesterase membrane domain-containing protein n=1 Tax=Brevibacterium marinum TaxID=418643 RepID=A0A846RUV3_9MICO|nr:hypothetical protein [Brevibacterium marinum]NJC57944.1 hypothetical protein [Brevibacterium marinum]
MGRSNAWTSEVDWQTGQWQQRGQGPTHHEWHPPSPRGILAKRPLTFFEVLDSGFRLLRFIPGLTIGAALIVFTLWTLVLTAVGTFMVLRFLPFLDALVSNDDAMSGFFLLAQMGSFAISLLSLGAAHFLAGLASGGAENSFGARKTTLSQSWASLRGRRWSLILAALVLGAINLGLLVLFGLPALLLALFDNTVLAVVAALLALVLWVCALIWLNLRFAFTGSTIAVEGLRVGAALRRSWRLTSTGFRRTLGQLGVGYFLSNQLVQLIISPLVTVVTVVATVAVNTADAATLTIIGVIAGAILLVLTTVSSAILFAYFSCLVCVCYFDRRMRTEGFDLVLIRREEKTA